MRELFYAMYRDFVEKGYFQQSFGYVCVDSGYVPGAIGKNIGAFFLRKLRKDLWPVDDSWETYGEEDLFDAIELLFDLVSAPVDGFYHGYSDCGWHYESFDRQSGQNKYCDEINDIIQDYADGYELSSDGEILLGAHQGLEDLLVTHLPELNTENVETRIERAILKFRRYRSSVDERREAVRSLADVLEYLRPRLREVLLSKDESDLFNIANNFGIRHHNPNQKTAYDPDVWLNWMFYFYLATIHAVVQLIKKNDDKAAS